MQQAGLDGTENEADKVRKSNFIAEYNELLEIQK